MIQKPKSSTIYQQNILDVLTQTGIKMTSPGGKARAFCDIVGDQLGQLEVRQFVNLSQTLLPYATGDSLDFLGAVYGVTRIPRSDVISNQSEGNFKFYVLSGTFGTINNGNDIIIPAGVRVFTNADNGPVYVVDQVILPAGSSSQVFTAISLFPGSQGVAPAGVFTRHNFTNYADSGFGSLLVSNDFGLIGGRDVEDDDSYRYRINLRLQSHGGSSEDDIRLAVLQVPGVQDLEFVKQSGTFLVYVHGVSPSVSPSLLQNVQSQIESYTAFPMVGTAVAPDLVGISLSTSVSLVKSATSSDQSSILAAIAGAAEDYINNLGKEGELVINQLADRMLGADSKIRSIGDPDRPINSIFIWRSRQDSTRYSRYLVNDYASKPGERIVVETLQSPIDLSIS